MEFNRTCTLCLLILLNIFFLEVTANKHSNHTESHKKSQKRQVHVHGHRHENTEQPNVAVTVVPPKSHDALHGLFPDIRPCYEGIPRIYERFAKERLAKRLKICSEIEPNTTALCHKECILLHLGFITTYSVTVMTLGTKLRRYKVNHNNECGHNLFGQDLLGIDTKIWDDNRALKQKAEKELYYKKVEEIGIRNFELDPFRLKFATQYGEDIVDERLEAQMRICRLFDITVNNADCVNLTAADKKTLSGLIDCVETALTC